ncbi:hypothetical protein SRABI106_02002 [Rahnella aquatilis]|nr:hypothetical protein SRABI106_02002 [Rahnella aquatilis]
MQRAQVIEISPLIAFAVIRFRQHRPADFLQRGSPRLSGGDLQRQRVNHFQTTDAVRLALLIFITTGNVRQRDIGITIVFRVIQHRQRERDVFCSQW